MADFLDEEWAYPHSKIVSESFSTVTFDEAVSLVGIVSTYAIRPSDELQALALKAENLELNNIEQSGVRLTLCTLSSSFLVALSAIR